jgi:hypothetical protein
MMVGQRRRREQVTTGLVVRLLPLEGSGADPSQEMSLLVLMNVQLRGSRLV